MLVPLSELAPCAPERPNVPCGVRPGGATDRSASGLTRPWRTRSSGCAVGPSPIRSRGTNRSVGHGGASSGAASGDGPGAGAAMLVHDLFRNPVAQGVFTLLGLWWVVMQFKFDALGRGFRRSDAWRAMWRCTVCVPGVMSLFACSPAGDGVGNGFGSVANLRLSGAVLTRGAAAAARRTRLRVCGSALAAVIYLVVAIVASARPGWPTQHQGRSSAHRRGRRGFVGRFPAVHRHQPTRGPLLGARRRATRRRHDLPADAVGQAKRQGCRRERRRGVTRYTPLVRSPLGRTGTIDRGRPVRPVRRPSPSSARAGSARRSGSCWSGPATASSPHPAVTRRANASPRSCRHARSSESRPTPPAGAEVVVHRGPGRPHRGRRLNALANAGAVHEGQVRDPRVGFDVGPGALDAAR